MSVRSFSWFAKSKLKIFEVLLYTYGWWAAVPMNFVRENFFFSERTIVDWASFCREVAIDEAMKNSEAIGGPGIIVEIDESKFGKSITSAIYLLSWMWPITLLYCLFQGSITEENFLKGNGFLVESKEIPENVLCFRLKIAKRTLYWP